MIWLYYIDRTIGKSKNMVKECRGPGCGKLVKCQNTSNFITHQRMCPGLLEAHRRGMPGIMCDVPAQATFQQGSSELVLPFKHSKFLAAVMKWIIVSGLPFTTIQNPHLVQAFQEANPDARLQSARTLARKLEDTFDNVNTKVLDEVCRQDCILHYTHDSWTDSGRKNTYFGVYISYIDTNWQYQELLLTLMHMRGSHTGQRMGDGLFDLFHNIIGISGQLGPGTGDNASNNKKAAMRLEDLLRARFNVETRGQEFVGCICHIANIAALEYISGEGK
jgi:hypothetical protein